MFWLSDCEIKRLTVNIAVGYIDNHKPPGPIMHPTAGPTELQMSPSALCLTQALATTVSPMVPRQS